MKKRFIRDGLIALATVAGMTLAGGPAKATIIETFALTSDHCDGTGGCLGGATSAGTVTVTDNGTNMLVFDVTLASGFQFIKGGFDASFGFNLFGISSITYTGVTAGFAPVGGSPQNTGSLHIDGTGYFEFGLNCTGCGSGASSPLPGPLDFTIAAATLDMGDVQQNALGQFFAVDVIGPDGNTGAVDASAVTSCGLPAGCVNPPPQVPEPTSLALLGSGLAAFGLLFGLRRRSTGVA
jgi:PEP-CTERM motif